MSSKTSLTNLHDRLTFRHHPALAFGSGLLDDQAFKPQPLRISPASKQEASALPSNLEHKDAKAIAPLSAKIREKAMLQADPVDVLPLPKALAVIPTPGRGDFRGQPLNEPRHRGRMLGELTRPETNALPRPNLFDTLCA